MNLTNSSFFCVKAALAFTVLCLNIQAKEPVAEMIDRLTKGKAEAFQIKHLDSDSKTDSFRISKSGGKILLEGSSKSAQSAAFGWYLKHVANGHLSWSGDQIPQSLPLPKTTIKKSTPYRSRFAHNYCALSYTTAFWDWNRWQREVDFLASNGINQLLIIAGTEEVWQRTLTELGYPQNKIDNFISSPAYAAWWLMGNLEGEGTTMSSALRKKQALLGKKLFHHCRDLGIAPIVQGFVGLLPHDIDQHVKGLKTIPQGHWVTGYQRPAVLDPTSKEFKKIAAIWYKHADAVYGGEAGGYAGDLFHEGGKKGHVDLTEAAKSVQTAMLKANPDALWVLMNWQANPPAALIAGTRKDRTEILQLCRNMKDGNNGAALRSFQKRPWLWGELANFGGNHNLYGGDKLVASLPSLLLNQPKLGDVAGVALLSEGFETNPYYYDIFFDSFWRNNDINLSTFKKDYTRRRYGKTSPAAVAAFDSLSKSVYNPQWIQEGCLESILCATPNRNARKASTWSSGRAYYNPTDVLNAAELLIKDAPLLQHSETYRYDLADVVRQVLTDLAKPLLEETFAAYDSGDIKQFEKLSATYLDLILDTDRLLATHQNWTLGSWTQPAVKLGVSKKEKAELLTDAKRLITTWNAKSDALDNYSHRQFSGLMKDYYHKRWAAYFKACSEVMHKQRTPASLAAWYRKEQAPTDLAFATDGKQYTTKAHGNTVEIAQEILHNYAPMLRRYSKIAASKKGYPWRLSQMKETFTFDVNEVFMATGTYKATFLWKHGSSALKIHSVSLYEGDKLITQDKHEGWTGIENRHNTYTIKLDKLRKNLDTYTLKVKVSGASSSDSSGRMLIKKAE